MLVNSCKRDLNRMRVSISRKASVAGPQEGRHAVSKFRRAVGMKVAVKDRKEMQHHGGA